MAAILFIQDKVALPLTGQHRDLRQTVNDSPLVSKSERATRSRKSAVDPRLAKQCMEQRILFGDGGPRPGPRPYRRSYLASGFRLARRLLEAFLLLDLLVPDIVQR